MAPVWVDMRLKLETGTRKNICLQYLFTPFSFSIGGELHFTVRGSCMVGTTISHYEVLEKIGDGGQLWPGGGGWS